MDTLLWTVLGLAALSLVLLLWGLQEAWQYYLDPRRKALSQRLKGTSSAEPGEPALKLRSKRLLSALPQLDQWLRQWSVVMALDQFLLQTGMTWSVSQVILIALSVVLWSATLGASLGWPVVLVLAVTLLGLMALTFYLQHRRRHRMVLIEQAMPDALDLIARAMQAGHAFTSALQMAAKDSPAPLSQELRMVFEEINFGISTTQALQALSARVASDDVRFFVVSVIIQNDTGGNLAEILKNTANLIRERQKMAGVVRVLSAEGRISALILSIMPFALAALLSLLHPGFISKLWTDPMGLQLIYVSLSLMALGILWMWKMIQIRV